MGHRSIRVARAYLVELQICNAVAQGAHQLQQTEKGRRMLWGVTERNINSGCTREPATASRSQCQKPAGMTHANRSPTRGAKLGRIYMILSVDPISGSETPTGIITRTQLEARKKLSEGQRIVVFERHNTLP